MNRARFFFSSRRRHTRYWRDWSSDVCSSDLGKLLERCPSLTTDQLQLTAPGTYGSIQKTFVHIVRANVGYLNTYGLIPQPFIELTASVDEIASRLARVLDAVEQLFKSKEIDFDE